MFDLSLAVFSNIVNIIHFIKYIYISGLMRQTVCHEIIKYTCGGGADSYNINILLTSRWLPGRQPDSPINRSASDARSQGGSCKVILEWTRLGWSGCFIGTVPYAQSTTTPIYFSLQPVAACKLISLFKECVYFKSGSLLWVPWVFLNDLLFFLENIFN